MNLVSEGVYLDENCATNPSRHLPGPKTAIQTINKKMILGSRGFRAKILYINSRSTALSGLCVKASPLFLAHQHLAAIWALIGGRGFLKCL